MIIVTKEYCFFNKKEIGSLRKMQRYFGVKPKSYAGKVIGRLYANYFGKSKNMLIEYKSYYSKEFPGCEEFLVCRLNITRELVHTVIEHELYWYGDRRHLRDDISYNFDYEEKYKELFRKYVGGIIYEG